MKAAEFCYWMQSLFEVADLKTFNEKQTEQIRNHLALVFVHELDPKESSEAGLTAEQMQEIHDGLIDGKSLPKNLFKPRPNWHHGGGGPGLLRC